MKKIGSICLIVGVALFGLGSLLKLAAHSSHASATDRQLASWYTAVKPDYEAMLANMKTFDGTAAHCDAMAAAARTLQDDPPVPVPSVNTPWQAAIAAYARAGQECSAGIQSNDTAQINAASRDVDAAGAYMKQATAQLPA